MATQSGFLTPADVKKMRGRLRAHIDYADGFGHEYQLIECPRLQFIDRVYKLENNRLSVAERWWLADGELKGVETNGLQCALAWMLSGEPVLTTDEGRVYAHVPTFWLATRVIEVDAIDGDLKAFPAAADEDNYARVRRAVVGLRNKGLIDQRKRWTDIDRSTNPNSWFIQVKRSVTP